MLGPQRPNFEFFNQRKIRLVSWVILGIAVIGIATNKPSLGKAYFLSLFVIGWFISKGTNPPLGEQFYSLIFSKLSLMQVYRNSYEKFGVVWLLAYSVFFGLGLSKLPRLGAIAILVITCGYLLTPFWSSETMNNLAGISVPDSYVEADSFIKSRGRPDVRIFQLPFLRGQLTYYKWNYVGEGPAEFLFDNASISKTLTNKTIDEMYLKLGDPNFFRHNSNFTNILAVMNTGYIVLSDDVIITPYYQETSSETREHIKRWKGVNFAAKFSDLEVYEINANKIPGRLYVSTNLIPADNLDAAFRQMTTSSFDPQREVVLIKSQNENVNLRYTTYALPNYKIETFGPNKFRMQVVESNKTYILVLANNFDQAWEARVNNQLLSNRIIVNGYANGWIVDKQGSYVIDVVYRVWPWD